MPPPRRSPRAQTDTPYPSPPNEPISTPRGLDTPRVPCRLSPGPASAAPAPLPGSGCSDGRVRPDDVLAAAATTRARRARAPAHARRLQLAAPAARRRSQRAARAEPTRRRHHRPRGRAVLAVRLAVWPVRPPFPLRALRARPSPRGGHIRPRNRPFRSDVSCEPTCERRAAMGGECDIMFATHFEALERLCVAAGHSVATSMPTSAFMRRCRRAALARPPTRQRVCPRGASVR